MTRFQRIMVALTAVLVLTIVAAIVVFVVVTRQQQIDANKAECDVLHESGSFAWFYCLELADN